VRRGRLERHLLRARDLIDARYAEPLDVPAIAGAAHVSPAHFSRRFKQTFGETPHQYLLTRRIERAKHLLRETDRSVTEISIDVGFHSLGSFSSKFTEIVGGTPTEYRRKMRGLSPVPTCVMMAWTRPRGRAVFEKS
jgi:AraC-like DNA-binding protein